MNRDHMQYGRKCMTLFQCYLEVTATVDSSSHNWIISRIYFSVLGSVLSYSNRIYMRCVSTPTFG